MKVIQGIRLFVTALLISLVSLSAVAIQTASAKDASALEKIRSAGVIRIANTQTSPPWSMLGADNKPTGYDVAIALEVAKRMGVPKVDFVADSFKNFVAGLKADKYDLVMNDLTPTSERKMQVDFSDPYGVEMFRIFVHKNNTDITSRATLKGKRVGVSTGSSNESWARANLPGSDIRTYHNGALVFNDLAIGRIDAVIISHFGGMKYADANHVAVKEVGEPLTYQLSAAAMVKDRPALRQSVNSAIKSMMADGTIARLSREYVGKDYDMVGSIEKAQKE